MKKTEAITRTEKLGEVKNALAQAGFIAAVEEVIRVRTGERGDNAL